MPSPPPLRSRELRPVFLTGERVYLRAFLPEDKDHAAAWFPGPFPVNSIRAESFLKDVHKEEALRTRRLAIVRTTGDDLIGGARVWMGHWHSELSFQLAPWLDAIEADELRAEALELAVRWLRDDWELPSIRVELAADQPLTDAAAERLGMTLAARLREHVARPGGRADLIVRQLTRPSWSFPRMEEAADA